jgi:Fic family protein
LYLFSLWRFSDGFFSFRYFFLTYHDSSVYYSQNTKGSFIIYPRDLPMDDERKYRDTHPWITFSADLRKAPPKFWFMLGECQANCELIAHAPLPPHIAQRISMIYLTKGALASAAIAGNSLSEEEAFRCLVENFPVPPSQKAVFREVENIMEGCGRAQTEHTGENAPDITPGGIRELNRIVLRNLANGKDAHPGEYRTDDSLAEDDAVAPAEDCEWLVEHLCEWLNGPGFTGGGDRRIANAVIRATLAHIYLAGIRPFREGNGRTARLLEYHILVSAGVPAISAHLPQIHYNLTRAEYSRQIELIRETTEVVPFIHYTIQGLLDGLRRQTGRTREHQWNTAWRCYILEFFQDTATESDMRRCHLALDLSARTEPVPLSEIPLVSPRLAQSYAKRVERTLIRDLNFLKDAGLVEKTPSGYRARKETAAGFGTELKNRADSGDRESPSD